MNVSTPLEHASAQPRLTTTPSARLQYARDFFSLRFALLSHCRKKEPAKGNCKMTPTRQSLGWVMNVFRNRKGLLVGRWNPWSNNGVFFVLFLMTKSFFCLCRSPKKRELAVCATNKTTFIEASVCRSLCSCNRIRQRQRMAFEKCLQLSMLHPPVNSELLFSLLFIFAVECQNWTVSQQKKYLFARGQLAINGCRDSSSRVSQCSVITYLHNSLESSGAHEISNLFNFFVTGAVEQIK